MTDIFNALHKTRRKGVGIVECLVLIIVLGVTLGAVFTTMAWAQKSYTFSKQDKESREILFNWAQTFESLWPTETFMADHSTWDAQARLSIENVGRRLGTWDSTRERARIGGYYVTATPVMPSGGSMGLNIVIRASGKDLVKLMRRYNVYSTDTVSDDVLVGG